MTFYDFFLSSIIIATNSRAGFFQIQISHREKRSETESGRHVFEFGLFGLTSFMSIHKSLTFLLTSVSSPAKWR